MAATWRAWWTATNAVYSHGASSTIGEGGGVCRFAFARVVRCPQGGPASLGPCRELRPLQGLLRSVSPACAISCHSTKPSCAEVNIFPHKVDGHFGSVLVAFSRCLRDFRAMHEIGLTWAFNPKVVGSIPTRPK